MLDALDLPVVLMQLLRTSAYVSIRQHTPVYVSIRMLDALDLPVVLMQLLRTSA
jgi:hypothetical protein